MTKREAAKPDDDIVPIGEFAKRSVHLSWPEPIHDALEELLEAAGEVDIHTNRSEIAAALVLRALANNRERNQLGSLLESYRSAKIMYTQATQD